MDSSSLRTCVLKEISWSSQHFIIYLQYIQDIITKKIVLITHFCHPQDAHRIYLNFAYIVAHN